MEEQNKSGNLPELPEGKEAQGIYVLEEILLQSLNDRFCHARLPKQVFLHRQGADHPDYHKIRKGESGADLEP